MRREQLVNNGVAVLASAMTDVQTTATVADGSVFPATGDFRIIVDDELMLVTARSTNVLTVVRGIENTTGVAHTDADVYAIVTVDSLETYFKENSWSGNGAFPLRIFKLSDGDFGVAATFTWVNQGGATATDRDGRIVLLTPSDAGQNIRALVQTAPTAPYEIVMAFSMVGQREVAMQFGLTFRESSTGKLFAITRHCDDTLEVVKHTNPTTLSASVLSPAWHFGNSVTWFKIEDDNTDLKFHVSPNGQDWLEIASETRTTFMAGAPNQVGFYGNPNAASTSNMLAEVYAFGEV